MHDRNQDRLLVNRRFNIRWADPSCRIDRHIGNTKSVQTLQGTTGIEHSRMLCYLRDDMIATGAPGKRDTANGKIIALGTAGCKNYLVGRTMQQPCYLLPCVVNVLMSYMSLVMCT